MIDMAWAPLWRGLCFGIRLPASEKESVNGLCANLREADHQPARHRQRSAHDALLTTGPLPATWSLIVAGWRCSGSAGHLGADVARLACQISRWPISAVRPARRAEDKRHHGARGAPNFGISVSANRRRLSREPWPNSRT